MEKDKKIYIAGDTGLVGSAIKKRLEQKGYTNFYQHRIQSMICEISRLLKNFLNSINPIMFLLLLQKLAE